MRKAIVLLLFGFLLCGSPIISFAGDLTLGLVQSQIKKGMTQGEVAQAIGSPNIASKDRNGTEVWIYDKVSSETETKSEGASKEKSSGFAVGGGAGGLLGSVLGGIFGGINSQHGDSSSKEHTKMETAQKTLTVVIKFDKHHLVKSTDYNMSQF